MRAINNKMKHQAQLRMTQLMSFSKTSKDISYLLDAKNEVDVPGSHRIDLARLSLDKGKEEVQGELIQMVKR